MPAPDPLIRTAELAGGGNRISEDRIFCTRQAVVVLDGATQLDDKDRDGGWLAEALGSLVVNQLEEAPNSDLRQIVERAIRQTAKEHGLKVGESPSTTISIIRLTPDTVDVLVLCDSPVVVETIDGQLHVIEDKRLERVAQNLGRPKGPMSSTTPGWNRYMDELAKQRNTPSGFWVAETDPTAAQQAIVMTFRRDDVGKVVVMTDGVTALLKHGFPANWEELTKQADEDPRDLIDAVHEHEECDLELFKYPRSKPHDDKAIAVINLVPADWQ